MVEAKSCSAAFELAALNILRIMISENIQSNLQQIVLSGPCDGRATCCGYTQALADPPDPKLV